MRCLTKAEVHAQKVAELGLDSNALDLTSIEAIANALRRAASILCPCSAATLVHGVVLPLRGLVDDLEAMNEIVRGTLEAMIAHGDIIEQRDIEGDPKSGTSMLLYAAPASFVVRASGVVILLGVATDQLSVLPDDLQARIEYVNHLRRLRPIPGEDISADLRQLGLIELSYKDWLKAPTPETPTQYVARFDRLLDAAQPSRDIPGLVLLHPEKPVRYYRGRWGEPRSHSGRFVARRSQAYGSDLWCYVKMQNGNPERFVDLPSAGSFWRGCDEAWRLQMAIDATHGQPQQFRVRSGSDNTVVLELFSPVPMWAQRRWDAVGEPVLSSGCLLAYRLGRAELEEELRFTREILWLEDISDSICRTE